MGENKRGREPREHAADMAGLYGKENLGKECEASGVERFKVGGSRGGGEKSGSSHRH